MIANPIIRKEVLSTLRTRKAVIMQALFLLASAALVGLLWPAGGLQATGGAEARRILGVLAIGEVLLVGLFAPALTAASLTSEKERNTLESLFTTTMKPWQITLGKMVGSLSFLVLLALSGAPALGCVFLLGGVTGREVLAVLGILVLTAVYLGMIGFFISTLAHRSSRAMIVTYGAVLVVMLAMALPAWPVSRHLVTLGGPTWQGVMHTLVSFSPLEAILSLVWPDGVYTRGGMGMPAYWMMFLPMSLGVIVLLAGWCMIRLRRPPEPPRPREKLKVVERGQVSVRTFFFLIDPRKRKRPISWWKNPVLVKEFRTRPMLQTQWLLRAVGICLIVSVLLMFLVNLSMTAFVAQSSSMPALMATAVGAMMVVLVALLGPAISAGAICSDRETGVWDLLRVTPLASWRIVSGKFQASIIPLLLLTIATIPALLILLYFNLDLLGSLIRVCGVVGMTILFVVTAGVFCSSLFRRTSTATAWTYALVVSMTLATLLILLAEDLFSRRVIEAVFTLNPVVAAMDAAGHAGMRAYSVLWNHLRVMGMLTAGLFVLTVIRVFQLRRAH